MNWLRAPLRGDGQGGETPPALWLLVLLTGCGTLSLHILVPALPAMARELGVSNGAIQLAVTLYLVGLASGQLVMGTLSDLFGRRPVLLLGLLAYVGGGLAIALAPSLLALLIARVVQSAGGCAGLVLGRAIIRDTAEPRAAAARLAMVNLVMSVSPALAPLIGGYLTVWGSWRLVFVLLSAIGLVGLLVSLLRLPETHPNPGGGGFRAMFRASAGLVRDPRFVGLALAGAFGTTCFYAFMSASPFIFGEALGRPTEEIGLYYAILFLGITGGSFIANRLVGRFGPLRLLIVSLGVAILASAALLAIDLAGALSLAGVVGCMLVFTLGVGVVSPMALTLAISVQPHSIGTASGLYGFTQMGFGALTTFVMSLDLTDPAFMAALLQTLSTLAAGVMLALAQAARTRRLP
jgi:DHA1 family bicyclomycin/chloramphenicol resistance-like MFS transporter